MDLFLALFREFGVPVSAMVILAGLSFYLVRNMSQSTQGFTQIQKMQIDAYGSSTQIVNANTDTLRSQNMTIQSQFTEGNTNTRLIVESNNKLAQVLEDMTLGSQSQTTAILELTRAVEVIANKLGDLQTTVEKGNIEAAKMSEKVDELIKHSERTE